MNKEFGLFAFLWIFVGCAVLMAQTGTNVNYIYDEAGQIIGVSDEGGNAAAYKYDAVGNLISIERLTARGPVDIFFVVPNRGRAAAPPLPGTTVTIYGFGFSATPDHARNQVTFNGVPAEVDAATTTVIKTKVPARATTGPIQVTISGRGTGTSRSDFVVNPTYRRAITISNSGSALTNYQILLTLDTAALIAAGKMRRDGGDVRFADSDGTTPLNYWVESGVNTPNTKVWVKVPAIPSGSKTIYVRYGDLDATSASSPSATMEKYEDMQSVPTCTLKNDAFYDSANKWVRLTRATGGTQGQCEYQYNPGNGLYGKIEFWAGGGNGADAVWLYAYDVATPFAEDVVRNGYHFTFDEWQSRMCFTRSTSDNGPGIACAFETTIANAQWHTGEIRHFGRNAKIWYDGVLRVDGTDDIDINKSGNFFGVGGRTGAYVNEHRVRKIIIAKYTLPEPTIRIGAEE